MSATVFRPLEEVKLALMKRPRSRSAIDQTLFEILGKQLIQYYYLDAFMIRHRG